MLYTCSHSMNRHRGSPMGTWQRAGGQLALLCAHVWSRGHSGIFCSSQIGYVQGSRVNSPSCCSLRRESVFNPQLLGTYIKLISLEVRNRHPLPWRGTHSLSMTFQKNLPHIVPSLHLLLVILNSTRERGAFQENWFSDIFFEIPLCQCLMSVKS